MLSFSEAEQLASDSSLVCTEPFNLQVWVMSTFNACVIRGTLLLDCGRVTHIHESRSEITAGHQELTTNTKEYS